MSKGIDHATCPKARIVKRLWTPAEQAFGEVLMKAFKQKVNVFVKVRVLDVIELDPAEPDKKRLFFWRDILGDKHFDYVVCRKGTLEPLIAVELDDPAVRKRSTTETDVKATAVPTASGAGLGLAIAQTIAEAHGGGIALDDRDEGASFRVTLPRAT